MSNLYEKQIGVNAVYAHASGQGKTYVSFYSDLFDRSVTFSCDELPALEEAVRGAIAAARGK